MDREGIIAGAIEFTQKSPGNYVSKEAAILPSYVGMKIFESPIFSVGKADDELFMGFKSPDVIGDHFLPPLEWLSTAKTVISWFLPYTDRIKKANAKDFKWPADEWLHGRIEGQIFINELSQYIQKQITGAGYQCIVPALDARLKVGSASYKHTSNWSERHAAFACGLGTFGLSKGLITEKGMCGRFGSIITELDLPVDARPYHDVYEYCTMCGTCATHCPVRAISLEEGKKHQVCSDFLDKTREKEHPRYGCAKCQVGVPCESGIPNSKKTVTVQGQAGFHSGAV